MINDLIYWVGVVTIIVFCSTLTMVCLWVLLMGFTKLIAKELGRAYNHAQLYYFMSRLKRTGLKELLKDVDKFAATEKTKEERAQNAEH